MRTALGATRLRILRQLLTEAVVLSLAGGALGVALAYLGIQLITALMPEYAIPHEVVIAINLPVLAFSVAVSIACGLVFGTAPGLQLSRPGAGHLVPSAGTRTATTRRSPLQVIMLAGQVALSVVLLAAGAAAVRHYLEAYTANLGFNPHPVLTLSAQLPEGSYPTWQARVNYYDQMLEKVSSLPGVASATFSSSYPGDAEWTTDVTVQGQTTNSGRESELQLISPGFFATLGIPQMSGRIFTRAEALRGAPLVVVNRAFVRKYFDGSDPIGRNLIIPDLDSSWPNIVKPTKRRSAARDCGRRGRLEKLRPASSGQAAGVRSLHPLPALGTARICARGGGQPGCARTASRCRPDGAQSGSGNPAPHADG